MFVHEVSCLKVSIFSTSSMSRPTLTENRKSSKRQFICGQLSVVKDKQSFIFQSLDCLVKQVKIRPYAVFTLHNINKVLLALCSQNRHHHIRDSQEKNVCELKITRLKPRLGQVICLGE